MLNEEVTKILDIITKALNKQIPEKVYTSYDGYADGNPVWEEHCPECCYDFDGSNPKYCPNCGQAIDWN